MCSRCCSCMLNPVHSQCGSFTGSLGEDNGDFQLSTARLNSPPFLQANSISLQSGSLQLFGRGESILVQLQEPCKQQANWNPSQVQNAGTMVSAVGCSPLYSAVMLLVFSSCSQSPTSCSNSSPKSCHSPACGDYPTYPSPTEGSASSAPCSAGRCPLVIQTRGAISPQESQKGGG